MTDRLRDIFETLRHHQRDFGVPDNGHFDTRVRHRIVQALHRTNRKRARQRPLRPTAMVASFAVLFVAVGGAFTWVSQTVYGGHGHVITNETSQANAMLASYPTFTPPSRMHVSYEFPAPNGNVTVVSYKENPSTSNGPGISDQTYVVTTIDGVQRTLFQMPALATGNATPSYWYTAGDVMYVALGANFSSAPYGANLALSILKLTPANGSWKVETEVSRGPGTGIPFGTIVNVNGRLLTYSLVIGAIEPPTWYDFTQSGVKATPVQDKWPDPSAIPHSHVYSFTTVTNPVPETTMNGPATAVSLQGSASPIHLHVGDTLIVEEHGDIRPVIATMDPTDPMHLTDRLYPVDSFQSLPSPYRQALLFKMKKPFKGTLLFDLHTFAKGEVVNRSGLTAVPIEVTQ